MLASRVPVSMYKLHLQFLARGEHPGESETRTSGAEGDPVLIGDILGLGNTRSYFLETFQQAEEILLAFFGDIAADDSSSGWSRW